MNAMAAIEAIQRMTPFPRHIAPADPDATAPGIAPVTRNPDITHVVVPIVWPTCVVWPVADRNVNALRSRVARRKDAARREDRADQKLARSGHSDWYSERER